MRSDYDRSLDQQDLPEVTEFKSITRIAQKDHKCNECRIEIFAGTCYRRQFLIVDGKPMVWRTHFHPEICQVDEEIDAQLWNEQEEGRE